MSIHLDHGCRIMCSQDQNNVLFWWTLISITILQLLHCLISNVWFVLLHHAVCLNMATPVPVLRLPKGPDPNSRGFDPNSPRFIALCRTSISTSAASELDPEELQKEQHARSVLREKFLRCLFAMTNKQVYFNLHEKVKVEATFGASDIDVLNFQVSDLHTPIGVQKEALIRSRDVISCHFDVWTPEDLTNTNRTLCFGLRGTYFVFVCFLYLDKISPKMLATVVLPFVTVWVSCHY